MTDRACLFGTYARQHSANRLLRAVLEAAGYVVVECHVPLWERTRDKLPPFFGPRSLSHRAVEYLRALPRLLAGWRAVAGEVSLLVAGFNGQLDMLVARRLARGRIPTMFAPLVTVTETLVEDREVYAPRSLGARLAHWLDRATLGAADLVLADTETHRAYMCETFRVPRARVQTLYLGAESPFYGTVPLADRPLRSVLFYGQYVPLHGVDTIIEAASQLAGRLEFTLVGTGPLRPTTEARARGLPNVRFVDWVEYEQLPAWIGRADLCLGVFGSSRKAAMVIPNKVYQGAAAGRPVITADTAGVREVFTHAESIWLVPPGDGRQLAGALAALAGDPARGRTLGRVARELMEERFSPERQGERLRTHIGDAIARRCRGAPVHGEC
jgi:glycosyltransferase involved in cell wall biosynthesis